MLRPKKRTPRPPEREAAAEALWQARKAQEAAEAARQAEADAAENFGGLSATAADWLKDHSRYWGKGGKSRLYLDLKASLELAGWAFSEKRGFVYTVGDMSATRSHEVISAFSIYWDAVAGTLAVGQQPTRVGQELFEAVKTALEAM